jgi:hypothetical protein
VLKRFLLDKPVLIAASCSSKSSITINTIRNSKWLMYQAELANICLENLKFRELTKKNDKVTSALFSDHNKYIVLTMGANNLPSIY